MNRLNDVSLPEYFEPRQYQKEAIDAWFKNGNKGILRMATGTGKTLTALYGMFQLLKDKEKLIVIIVCPYVHLVDQWAQDVSSMGVEPVLGYSSGTTNWRQQFYSQIQKVSLDVSDISLLIVTNSSFSSDDLGKILLRSKSDILLIADEMHNMGSETIIGLLDDRFAYRLGLSATPYRYFDDDGSDALLHYFNGEVFKFDLDDAIEQEFLTPYFYFPIIVNLTYDEYSEYQDLTQRISRIPNTSPKEKTIKEILLQKRARIIQNASEKLPVLFKLISENIDQSSNLIYCGTGSIDSLGQEIRQIDYVSKYLGNTLNIKLSRFTSEESSIDRRNIIRMFEQNEISTIVAIKCLDEGVNIPSIKNAYILSSSSNPKEYIQRRGRVLRKYTGKDFANIYDFVVLPPEISRLEGYEMGAESIVRRELDRVAEFSRLSTNKNFNEQFIERLMEKYNIKENKYE